MGYLKFIIEKKTVNLVLADKLIDYSSNLIIKRFYREKKFLSIVFRFHLVDVFLNCIVSSLLIKINCRLNGLGQW